jgi:hypothetical protein
VLCFGICKLFDDAMDIQSLLDFSNSGFLKIDPHPAGGLIVNTPHFMILTLIRLSNQMYFYKTVKNSREPHKKC